MKILICDPDPEYLKALVTYMINSKKGYEISAFSDENMFAEALFADGFLKKFDGIILASPFYEQVADEMEAEGAACGMPTIVRLLENKEATDEKSFYKYQSAEILQRMIGGEPAEYVTEERPRDSPLITLVSPVHHELLLPYALVLANIYADQSSVLLVDLEQISILPDFCGHDFQKDIMDLAYMLESSTDDEEAGRTKIRIEDYVEYVNGIAILAASSPMEINTLTDKQWKGVVNLLKGLNFSRIILLFDELHQGFDAAVRESSEVIALCRQGNYLMKSTETFIKMYEAKYSEIPLRQVYLQMSSTEIPVGNFRLEELMDGKLNGIIRKQLAAGN